MVQELVARGFFFRHDVHHLDHIQFHGFAGGQRLSHSLIDVGAHGAETYYDGFHSGTFPYWRSTLNNLAFQSRSA